MRSKNTLPAITVIAVLLLGSACGRQEAEAPAADGTAAGEVQEAIAAAPAAMPRTPSAEGARVFFITPADGDTVSSPVTLEFGIEGMTVVTAGDDTPQSGHHHLLVDAEVPDLGLPVPADSNHIHFGDARTATELALEPGQHTLRLLLGDHLHIPHDPPVMSDPITITVQ